MSETRTSRLAFRLGFVFLLLSAVLWIVTTVCFIGLWDHVAALTTFPQWSWAVIGILSLAFAWRLMQRCGRWLLLLLTLWVGTTLVFADNLLPLIRALVRGSPLKGPPPSGSIRVATLNCATSAAAAAEVIAFKPDIVLLQEIPPSNRVAQLARECFGDAAWFIAGLDCAIISRYPLEPIDERPSVHYARAVLILPHSRELLVTSLRLTPPLGAMDLWNPATWHAYREDRRLRRQQLQSVLDAQPSRPNLPAIIGGDFNAPAGDAIYRLLHEYRDSHRIAGRGWGGTALNTMPFFRPDQIWVRGLAPVASCAVRTIHSDHRMVITEVK
jgi:endonuclease/exonuclease/phosphatase (EEP) superfamily protein YafD